MKIKNKKIRKFKGGGMDASKPDFKTPSVNAFSSGYKGAKKTSQTTTSGNNTRSVSTGTVKTGTTGNNNNNGTKNFVQNLGYQVKQQATKFLGIDKPKTKNLNDLQITSREVGLNNRNLTGPARDLQTQTDLKNAFRTQGTYATRRSIKGMLPGGTKIAAKVLSPMLEKNTIRNRKFFDTSVVGTDKKGSLYSDKTMPTSLYDQNKMYTKYAKDRQDKKIDAFGRLTRPEGDGPKQSLCPDGSNPPCKTPGTQIKNPVTTQNSFLTGFKSYDDGGEVVVSSNVDKSLL